MIELGELERRHADFEQLNTRVVAASVDRPAGARKTQEQFPHLSIVSDSGRRLINAVGAANPHSLPDGSDAAASTTILLDARGTVRWLYRPERAFGPLSPDAVLAAVARYLPGGR